MNQPTAQTSVAGRQREQIWQEVGGSRYVFRLIIGLSVVGVFYLILLGSMILSALHIVSQQDTLSYFTAYTSLLGNLMNTMAVMIVILAAAVLIRVIPLIGCIILYRLCRNGAPTQSLMPAFTCCQVFGVIEALLWSALVVYDIINMFRYGFAFPKNAGSVYYMILVISVIMIVCKIAQGVLLTRFMARLKNGIRTETMENSYFGGLRFASVMLTVCHVILLIALVANLLIILGIGDFFKTFRYLWMWYLFFIGYILSNSFLSAVLRQYYRATTLSLSGVPTHTGYGAASPMTGGQYNPYQTYRSPDGSDDPYSQPPSYGQSPEQPFGTGYGQMPPNNMPAQNQPFGTGYGQVPPNNMPAQNQSFGTGYGQVPPNNMPAQNQSFGTAYHQSPQVPPSGNNYNASPQTPPAGNHHYGQPSVPPSAGQDPFGDMFTFNTHNRR